MISKQETKHVSFWFPKEWPRENLWHRVPQYRISSKGVTASGDPLDTETLIENFKIPQQKQMVLQAVFLGAAFIQESRKHWFH